MNDLLIAIDETWNSLDNLLRLLPEGETRDLAENLHIRLSDYWEAGLATLRAQPARGMWTREESSPANSTQNQTLPVQSRPAEILPRPYPPASDPRQLSLEPVMNL